VHALIASGIATGAPVLGNPFLILGAIYAKNSGSWQQPVVYAKHSGTWKAVSGVWAKRGGTWKQIYQG